MKITQEKINNILFDTFQDREKVEPKEIPVIKNLDSKIYESIQLAPKRFDMSTWHRKVKDDFNDISIGDFETTKEALKVYKSCGTAHCRAGWAIALGGKKAVELETKVGAQAAGSLIYFASTGHIPQFTNIENKSAKADIRKRARAEQKAAKK